MLWIHGPASFGKSFLCAAIVESLEIEDESKVMYHFCTSSSAKQDKSSSILKAWIAQLVSRDDEILDLAREEMHTSSSQANIPSLWKLFRGLAEKAKQCVFLVDGLDECETAPHQ